MPLENTYIQSYDHGTSIEEIEEQMDDWLENRSRTQKKQVITLFKVDWKTSWMDSNSEARQAQPLKYSLTLWMFDGWFVFLLL